jgi:hypothetical protein
MAIKIFISHHTHDAALAETLVRLLRDAFNLTPSEIRYTTHATYGLSPGAPVADTLSKDLHDSRVMIVRVQPTNPEKHQAVLGVV